LQSHSIRYAMLDAVFREIVKKEFPQAKGRKEGMNGEQLYPLTRSFPQGGIRPGRPQNPRKIRLRDDTRTTQVTVPSAKAGAAWQSEGSIRAQPPMANEFGSLLLLFHRGPV
jgi:hypothetical protein